MKLADEVGVENYALENFSAMLVWNPETLFRLRDAVGPKVGMNLDPSHLMWMGADPIASARALGRAIHHCHGKDTRIERGLADVNGLLELKDVDRRRQPSLELRRRRRRPRPAVVEGVLLRRADDGLQRLGKPRDGRLHHVHRGRHPVLHRRAPGHDQSLSPARAPSRRRAFPEEPTMQNPITITCAPCCWGVDDVKNPHLPPWERVLDEAAEAGFGGLELGPYGYMPLDVRPRRRRPRRARPAASSPARSSTTW